MHNGYRVYDGIVNGYYFKFITKSTNRKISDKLILNYLKQNKLKYDVLKYFKYFKKNNEGINNIINNLDCFNLKESMYRFIYLKEDKSE